MKLVHDASLAVVGQDPVLAALSAEPTYFEIDFSDCLRLVGGSAANGDNNDPIVLQGEAEFKFRKLIALFGFERLPFTHGEAQGLLEYCERLDTAAGLRMQGQTTLRNWQEAAIKVFSKTRPHMLPALRLLCAQDIVGLRELHKREETLTKLGREFMEFAAYDE